MPSPPGRRSSPGVVATARDQDGVLQAMEAEGERFALGVQWYPEAGDDPGLFDGLVAAARAFGRTPA